MSPPLRAVTFSLDENDFRALADHGRRTGGLFERDGSSVAFFGAALELPLANGLDDSDSLEEVTARLASLSEPGGSGRAVAVGALPFRPDQPSHLRVPEVLALWRGDEREAVVVASGAHGEVLASLLAQARETGAEDGSPPDAFELSSAHPHQAFMERVAKAASEVASGRLEKVVLAREVRIEANRAFRQGDLLERLRSLHPSCLTFAVEGFLGASPELLISRRGRRICSHPLAGTAARSGDLEADRQSEERLLSSSKERSEHRAVVEAIAAGLGPATSQLEVPGGPEIVALRNVSHLGTRISGELAERSDGTLPSALEAVALIHPTPAVCGTPTEAALEYISKEEELERGRYAGPLGWLRADGDGEFHLGIRAGEVSGTSARLFAGGGILADSDPAAELRETQLKLQAMLAALVRP